jgi:signal peptidase I
MADHRAEHPGIVARLRPWLLEARMFVRLAALTAMVGLLFWGIAPYAMGWHASMITSDSMTPGIRQGDVIVLMPIDRTMATIADLRGRVVQIDDPARPGHLLMHRVVKRDANGSLITKGDANASADRIPVPPSAVRGVARLRVPLAGLPVLWLRTGQGVPLAALGLAGIVVMWPERRRTTVSQVAAARAAATT